MHLGLKTLVVECPAVYPVPDQLHQRGADWGATEKHLLSLDASTSFEFLHKIAAVSIVRNNEANTTYRATYVDEVGKALRRPEIETTRGRTPVVDDTRGIENLRLDV